MICGDAMSSDPLLHCKEKIKYFQKLLKTQAEATPTDGCWTMVATD
jgi:hypothetical protein